MDDYNLNVLSEAKNEYSSRLINILSPLVIQGIKSIFNEALDLCIQNEEGDKYLMTFQNFLSRVPRWNTNIITEEKNYLQKFKQSFGNNLIFYNSFRSEINDAFEIYPRKLHRYRLGLEILIECLILSKCNGIISNMTNVSSASIFLSKKRNKIFNIFLGYNSANKFIASFLWFLKKSTKQFQN